MTNPSSAGEADKFTDKDGHWNEDILPHVYKERFDTKFLEGLSCQKVLEYNDCILC